MNDHLAVLAAACAEVGLDHTNAEPIRMGENALFRLPAGVVARIARSGQLAAAAREVRIAQWLAEHEIPAVRVLKDITQPVEVGGRAVTFWEELPPHRNGTPAEVATAIRRLHDLPIPTDVPLGELAPFVRLTERINAATTLTEADRTWLSEHLASLQASYVNLPPGLPHCVVHGDAWIGNVVVTNDGQVVLLDLERCSVGPPEWDLVSTAIKHTSFNWITAEDYLEFCDRYNHDVTTWTGFDMLRDIRELRMVLYVAQRAGENSIAHQEAALRAACLQRHSPRPWPWTPSL